MPCKITARNDTYSTYRGGLLSRSGASFFASHVQYNLATQYSCCLRTCILLVPVLTLDQQTLTFQGVQNRKSGITGAWNEIVYGMLESVVCVCICNCPPSLNTF
jgi:hypothetical protein